MNAGLNVLLASGETRIRGEGCLDFGGGLGSFSYLTRYTAAVGWITNLAPLKAARLVIIALIVLFTIVAATRKPKV